MKDYLEVMHNYRFLILWVAFLLHFISPSLEADDHFLVKFTFKTLAIFAGLNVLYARKKIFYFVLSLSLLIIFESFFKNYSSVNWLNSLSDVLLLVFYLIIISEIFKELFDFTRVDLNTLGALLSGYFVLGIIGGVIFSLLETNYPGSFTGLEQGNDPVSDLMYFSFVTLTTVGFGDISPLTQFAQRLTVLVGIMGNVYSTVVIGIILSQFVSANPKMK